VRLAEELEEIGLPKDRSEPFHEMLLEEIDYVLRPAVHERRIVSSGTILEPKADPDSWASGTQLDISRTPVVRQPLGASRRFADGLSSWLVRRTDGSDEWVACP